MVELVPEMRCAHIRRTTRFSSLSESLFSHNLQICALLSGVLPYTQFQTSTLCPRILNRATFLKTFLLRTIFNYPGKTNGARASQNGLSGKAKNCDKPQAYLN